MGKFEYYFFSDQHYKKIEEILNCKLICYSFFLNHGRYCHKYIDYLVAADLDESKVNVLQQTIKHKVIVINRNFTYHVRVYHQQLMKYIEFEPIKSKQMILGYNYNGLMKIPITSQENNYLLVGASGSGKSCLAQSIVQNLINNNIEVWICDNKGSFDYDNFGVKLGKNVSDCLKMINEFEDLVEDRLCQNKKHSPMLFVIDEIFPLSCCDAKLKKSIMNKLALIMSRCRSANCHLMLISQRNTSDIIDTRLMANISIRICLKTSSKQESINAIDCDAAHKIDVIGRGYVSLHGELEEFQSFYLKEILKKEESNNGENDRKGYESVQLPCKNQITNKFL